MPESLYFHSFEYPAGTFAIFAALPTGLQFGVAIVLGLTIGSFINVVAHRLPIMMKRAWQSEVDEATGQSTRLNDDGYPSRYNLWKPRSKCPRCSQLLRAWENIPVVSYLLLRGRCSHCGTTIAIRYLLLELATGALAAGALAVFGPTATALAAFGLCAALLTMSAIDIRTGFLPDILTLPLLWAGLIVNLSSTFVSLHTAVLGAITGYLFLWCVYWLFKWLRGIEGIGYGDFKLLAALGAWLGWAALPQVVLIAALAGAVVGLAATWRGQMRFGEPLPFGPFLATGGAMTLFFGPFFPFFYPLLRG